MPPPIPRAEINRTIESCTIFVVNDSAKVKIENTNTASRIAFRRPTLSASMVKATAPIIHPRMLMSATSPVIRAAGTPQSSMIAGAA